MKLSYDTPIVIEDNKNISKFLAKHEKHAAEILDRIQGGILEMINEKEHKIKIVKDCKYLGHPVWEYKIILNPMLTFRVGYVITESNVTVFFLSTTLIKREFTKEVINYLY